MSHYYHLGGNHHLNFNPDLSEVVLLVADPGKDRSKDLEIKLDGEKLLGFIAHYVRNARIGALEDATDREVLGVPK